MFLRTNIFRFHIWPGCYYTYYAIIFVFSFVVGERRKEGGRMKEGNDRMEVGVGSQEECDMSEKEDGR